MREIFIPYNVPSSKNSRRWTGKMSIASKPTMRYYKLTETIYPDFKGKFLKLLEGHIPPYKIGLHFVRDSRRRYDWVNPVQTIQDRMVKFEWLEDDNVTFMFPFPYKKKGVFTTYDKNNPGVYIKVIK